MSLPADLLHRPPEEAVRRIALELLDEAHAASLRLDDPKDAEALHDFRVAVRRLRSLLRAWKKALKPSARRKDRVALKAVQTATGGGRDAEVALEWLAEQRPRLASAHRRGLDWLALRLKRQHDEAMAHAREGVREAFQDIEADLRERLETLTLTLHLRDAPTTETLAGSLADSLRSHFEDLRSLLLGVASHDEQGRLHQSRIATKRLRYLVEPVRPHCEAAVQVVKRCKQLQDVLGDMNDAHVQLEELGGSIEAAALEQARRLHELSLTADAATIRREARRSTRPGLLELVRRARARLEGLHARLEDDWLADGLLALSRPVDALVAELEAAAREGREVERKYLLRELPAFAEDAERLVIEQGWLPGDKVRERIRRVVGDGTERFFRTIKAGAGLERVEIEEETSREVFEGLWPLTEGSRVRKRRYRQADGDLVWEVDEFLDRELFLAEVELPDRESEVEVPEWLSGALVKEVTGDPRYVNLNLAR